MEPVGASPAILINHLGYDSRASKAAVLATPEGRVVGAVRLVEEGGRHHDLVIGPVERVQGWTAPSYRRVDFSHICEPGSYRIEAQIDGVSVSSAPFPIAEHALVAVAVSDVTAYFRSVRSSGEIDRKDAHARFYGDDSGREVDARGGWLDASGDYSKFLSHLTYTRMMSPQQIPLCAWALMASAQELVAAHPGFSTSQHSRLRDEALFGADFLVRFQAPEGYFYTGIFDALTKDLDERLINAPLQDSVRTQRWQAGYRHGGGLAIAALARASTLDDHGDFESENYLSSAVRGFDHLEEHNLEYSFDGQESVIDDYCALLAAAELVHAMPSEPRFLAAAHRRARSLRERLRSDERGIPYLLGDIEGRPFFHAAEAGLPVIALLRYAEVVDAVSEAGAAADARELALALLGATIARTDAVVNPFGYPRQRVQPTGGEAHDAFFYPHENETGYWWQGENATISSLAYAALKGAALAECDEGMRDRLSRLADDALAWVTGLNPFDSCMLQGRGRNTVDYSSTYQNSPGGIVNGITGGMDDERDIAFLPIGHGADGNEWRWAEQWIPHTAWFLLASCAAGGPAGGGAPRD